VRRNPSFCNTDAMQIAASFLPLKRIALIRQAPKWRFRKNG
jgi:hypothetical protein